MWRNSSCEWRDGWRTVEIVSVSRGLHDLRRCQENPMGKPWKITILNGKTMDNQHVQWEYYGQSTCLMGKSMEDHRSSLENYGKSPFYLGRLTVPGHFQ